jgi:hypothetical protein
MNFLKDLVFSREFRKGLFIGLGVMVVAYSVSWLVN